MEKSILEKIQKLLKLAESSNENEAKLAMTKAQDLMLRHNISMRSVENHDSEYINETSDTFKRKPENSDYINNILRKYFFIEIVTSKRHGGSFFNYIGEKNNVNTAIYMRNFITDTFKRLWLDYKKETGVSVRSKSSFMYGLHQGFCEKLEEQRQNVEQETGLVLVNDQKATNKMNELFSKLSKGRASKTTIRDCQAVNSGVRQGKKITISAGALK